MAADWVPIVSSLGGAVIAIAGTLAAGVRTDRSQRIRDREAERLRTYVDFAVVLDATHASLRAVAGRDGGTEPVRYAAANSAVSESDLYRVRERLLLAGSAGLALAGEKAFLRLIDIRDAVRTGARLPSREYCDVYHPYAEALWNFRLMARRELEQQLFTPETLGRVSWSERAECPHCGKASSANG